MIPLRMLMYSPKISEDIVPRLYNLAKQRKIAMTDLVNEMLENTLKNNPAYQMHGVNETTIMEEKSSFEYEKK